MVTLYYDHTFICIGSNCAKDKLKALCFFVPIFVMNSKNSFAEPFNLRKLSVYSHKNNYNNTLCIQLWFACFFGKSNIVMKLKSENHILLLWNGLS